VGVTRGCPRFFKYPVLSQEWVKLRRSNLAGTFIDPSEQKRVKHLGEKVVWAYLGTAQIFLVLLIVSGTGKQRTSNFVFTLIRSIATKAR